jgi:hypothetical protein
MSDPAPPPEGGVWTDHEEVELLRQILENQKEQLTATLSVATGVAEAVVILGTISSNLLEFLADWIAEHTEPSRPAVRGVLTIQGAEMGLTVDTLAATVTYGFEDDKGNADVAPTGDGSGITAAFASSDDTQATVGTPVAGTDAAGNPTLVAPITVVTTVPTAGVSFTGAAANVSGAALTNDNGGVWVDPPATAVYPITAGAPTQGELSVATP